jgi:hypothetical protein
MSNTRAVFFIGVMGGLVGYACGVAFTPTRAVAQQINPGDAGPPDPSGGAVVDGGPVAAGSVPRPACLQWEVKGLAQMVYGPSVVTVDEGWEPFAYYGGGGNVILRRCVK